jgi:hypothetical protein
LLSEAQGRFEARRREQLPGHSGKILDIVMLVFPGGQERTEAEYASLLGKAGFRLNRVVPTASTVSVVEAVPE